MCGEQSVTLYIVTTPSGSPPRVRGTVKDPLLDAVGVGITPACAGNSPAGGKQCSLGGDHPRVCGEQFMLITSYFS